MYVCVQCSAGRGYAEEGREGRGCEWRRRVVVEREWVARTEGWSETTAPAAPPGRHAKAPKLAKAWLAGANRRLRQEGEHQQPDAHRPRWTVGEDAGAVVHE
jgi:hypothetical protein